MPTLEEIKLTDEQMELMADMCEAVNSAPTLMKKLVRWQFWTKKIFLAGAAWQRKLSEEVSDGL